MLDPQIYTAIQSQHGDGKAEGILNAVRKDCAHLFVGAKAPETAIFKRISPALTRKLSMSTARKIGYA